MKVIIVPLTLLASFLSLIAVLSVAKLFGFSPAQFRDPVAALYPGTMFTVLAILITPILIVGAVQKWIHREPLQRISVGRFSGKAFFWGLVLGLLIKAAATASAVAYSGTASIAWALGQAPLGAWGLCFGWFFITLVLNSFNEELVYRAYPIRQLDSLWRTPVLVVLTATVFSLGHFLIEAPDLLRFTYRLSFGIFTGLLFVRQQTIWGIVGVHTGWNFVALTASDVDWRLGGILTLTGLDDRSETVANIVVLLLASVVLWHLKATLIREAATDRVRSECI